VLTATAGFQAFIGLLGAYSSRRKPGSYGRRAEGIKGRTVYNSELDKLLQHGGPPDGSVREGIGVDVDQWASLGAPANACIITSAEKHVESAVAQAIESIAAGSLAPGDVLYNAKNDGISAADFHDKASLFGPEVTTALQTALAGMQAGTLVTCPPAPACGTYTP